MYDIEQTAKDRLDTLGTVAIKQPLRFLFAPLLLSHYKEPP